MTKVYWVPLKYTIEHIPYRHRNSHGTGVREEYPISIRTIDPSEALHVATLTRSRDEKHVSTYSHDSINDGRDAATEVDVYHFEGQLYRNVVGPTGERTHMDHLKDEPEEKRRSGSGYPFSKRDVDYWPTHEKYLENVEIGRRIKDDRDDVIASAQEKASNLLVIGSHLFKPCVEPLLELRTDSHKTDYGLHPYNGFGLHVLLDGDKYAMERSGALFRLDELDEAIRIGEEHAGRENKKFALFGAADLKDASTLAYDVRPRALARLRKESASLGFHGFYECNTTDIRIWCDAEDRINADDPSEGVLLLRHFHTEAQERLQSSHALSMGIALDRYECLPALDLDLIGSLTF